MTTHVNTRFPVAVHVLVHAVQRAIFVINIVEMSQEYTGKKAVEKLIKALDHERNEGLVDAIKYAEEYKKNKISNINTLEFYSYIIDALYKVAVDISDKKIIKGKLEGDKEILDYLEERDTEFIVDLEKCKTEYTKITESLRDTIEDIDDIYRKYTIFYTINREKPKRKVRFNNGTKSHNGKLPTGGRRTMRAKRRRQI